MATAAQRSSKAQLEEQKLLLEIAQLKEHVRFQKTQDRLAKLELEHKVKPWWRRAPLQTLTLAVSIASAVIGLRPQTPAVESRIERPAIVESNRSSDHGMGGAPEPQRDRSRFRTFYLKYAQELEEERWGALLNGSSGVVREAIDELFQETRDVYGNEADVEILRAHVQSALEKARLLDPAWNWRGTRTVTG